MSPLTPEQQLSHAWRDELPGVTLYQESDEMTREVLFHAEAHVSSDLHRLTEEVLIRSNGEAGFDAVRKISEQMRERALDAFGLRPLIEEARREERAKYEAVAVQLDVARAAAEEQRDASKAAGDEPGTLYALGEVAALRRAAAAIRAVSAPPTRGT